MERHKRATYEGHRYPDIREAMDRRSLLKGAGLAGGALVVTTATGCIPHVMGMIAEPGEDTYQASLPPAPDVRTLYLEYQGTIDYHVVAVVWNEDLWAFLTDECDNLLDGLDQVLSTHPIQDFAPGSDPTQIVAEITQALADAFAGTLGAPTDDFFDVTFVVDYYDEDEEIDGDMADPE